MDNMFFQLALVLSLASFVGIIIFKLKLPLVVAYLISGLILSFARLIDLGHSPIFEILPELGIAFVLFLIGMELNLHELKILGKPIFITAIGQIFITTLLGMGISKMLGFSTIVGVYLGLGLAFSSTVVVIKMLLESRDLTSLYGKLSIGMLLVEDLVAIIVLIMISISNTNGSGFQNMTLVMMLLTKVIGLFLLTFVLSRSILTKIFEFTAQSTELLYITSITWCFTFTSLAVYLGFSIEIGAFLAGVALATSPYSLQIQAKIKPIRDFFVAIFFIYLGSTANFAELKTSLPIVIIFTVYALIVKPIVYLFLLSKFGFRKHTLFQTALNLSQISEFSLIVLLVGVNAGAIPSSTISIMATVAVLSITISSIAISFSKKLYHPLLPFITFFEKKGKGHYIEHKINKSLSEHIIVVGAHRVGAPIIKYLHDNNIPFIAMDFNPAIVKDLRDKNIYAIYGDIGDPEILDSLSIDSAKLVVCTASDFTDNELLLNQIKARNGETKIVLRATDSEHAHTLKEQGADYVLLPEKVSGDYIVHQIKLYWPNVNFKDGINFGNNAISSII